MTNKALLKKDIQRILCEICINKSDNSDSMDEEISKISHVGECKEGVCCAKVNAINNIECMENEDDGDDCGSSDHSSKNRFSSILMVPIENQNEMDNIHLEIAAKSPTVNLPGETIFCKREIFTQNRLVNCIMGLLDEANYDEWIPSDKQKVYHVIMEKDGKSSQRKSITWCNQQNHNRNNIRIKNINKKHARVKPAARNANTPLSAWQLFMTNDMITDIVSNTNKKIALALSDTSEDPLRQEDHHGKKLCDEMEIKAYIGLLYARGLYSMNKINHHYLFANAMGPPIFSATMSAKRFSFLSANISFDEPDTHSQRWQSDRFAAIRNLFEQFNDNCSSTVNPGEFLSLDETLYSCRTQINNSSQPSKYGLLFKSINCSHSPFTYRTVVHAGEPAGGFKYT